MNKDIRITTVSLVLMALANLCSPIAKAQSITGKWYGVSEITRAPGYHLSSKEEKGDILIISEGDSNKIVGIGYNYYWFRGEFYYYVKNLECSYDSAAKEWIIQETDIRDNHLFTAHYSCLRTYRLKFTKRNQKDSLNGNWTAASFDACGAGSGSFGRTRGASKIRGHADSIEAMLRIGLVPHNANKLERDASQMRRESQQVRRDMLQEQRGASQASRDSLQMQRGISQVQKDSSQMTSKDSAKQEAALQQMLARSRKQIQEISLKTPNIKVEIWDNNVIDGDNISLYFNKELIINRKRLTAIPITVNIKAIPGKDNELIMYANNLGEIPPNTAMMRIYANGKEYDVYMSSDEQSSGMVKFVLP